ncbi:MAG: PEP-CTERM sorting domain-containing protein [Fimbriimonadaceae bacterium]
MKKAIMLSLAAAVAVGATAQIKIYDSFVEGGDNQMSNGWSGLTTANRDNILDEAALDVSLFGGTDVTISKVRWAFQADEEFNSVGDNWYAIVSIWEVANPLGNSGTDAVNINLLDSQTVTGTIDVVGPQSSSTADAGVVRDNVNYVDTTFSVNIGTLDRIGIQIDFVDATGGQFAENPRLNPLHVVNGANEVGSFENDGTYREGLSSALNDGIVEFRDYASAGAGWRLYAEVEAVPEPATMLALGAGLAALAARRRRK